MNLDFQKITAIAAAFGCEPLVSEQWMSGVPVIGIVETYVGPCYLAARVSPCDGELDIAYGNTVEFISYQAEATFGALVGDLSGPQWVRGVKSYNGTPRTIGPVFVAALRDLGISIGPPPISNRTFMDGNQWCCVGWDFVNLQESPAGFGDTQEAAVQAFYAEVYGKSAVASEAAT